MKWAKCWYQTLAGGWLDPLAGSCGGDRGLKHLPLLPLSPWSSCPPSGWYIRRSHSCHRPSGAPTPAPHWSPRRPSPSRSVEAQACLFESSISDIQYLSKRYYIWHSPRCRLLAMRISTGSWRHYRQSWWRWWPCPPGSQSVGPAHTFQSALSLLSGWTGWCLCLCYARWPSSRPRVYHLWTRSRWDVVYPTRQRGDPSSCDIYYGWRHTTHKQLFRFLVWGENENYISRQNGQRKYSHCISLEGMGCEEDKLIKYGSCHR